jgi:serine/threonine kinase PknH
VTSSAVDFSISTSLTTNPYAIKSRRAHPRVGAGRLVARRHGMVTAVTAAVLVAVVGCSSHSSPTAATTTSTTPAQLTSLMHLMLSAQEVNAIMGATDMQRGQAHEDLAPTSSEYANPDCTSVMTELGDSRYQGSGYTAVFGQEVTEPGDTATHKVLQGAVAFPSAEMALAFVKNSETKWKSCGQSITRTHPEDDSTARWTAANLVGDAPNIALLVTQDGGNGWGCQRALHALANVVLDIGACSFQPADQASQIAAKMAAKATQ